MGSEFTLDKIGQSEIQRILTAAFSANVELLVSAEEFADSNTDAEAVEVEGDDERNEGVARTRLVENIEFPITPTAGPMVEGKPSQKITSIVPERAEPDEELKEKCVRLNMVLKSYGINAEPVKPELVQRAARFYRFKLMLKPGESISNLKKSARI